MILVTLESFKGEYAIADATGRFSTDAVQAYIDKYEPKYLRRMFGVALGNEIIAYLQANRLPLNADFDQIIDAFSYQDTSAGCCNSILESAGLHDALTAMVMYEYIHNELRNTQAGTAMNEASAGKIMTPRRAFRFAEHKYNKALETIDAIQTFICLNPAHYSGFDKYAGGKFKIKFGDVI